MRQTMTLVAAALLLAGCGGGSDAVDAPEVTITEAAWSGDEVAIGADTNLPDGAILSWSVIEGDDPDDLDAADVGGFATVTDGSATATADVAEFSDDTALVGVEFVANYSEQPAEVADAYGPPFTGRGWPADWKQRAADETTVTR